MYLRLTTTVIISCIITMIFVRNLVRANKGGFELRQFIADAGSLNILIWPGQVTWWRSLCLALGCTQAGVIGFVFSDHVAVCTVDPDASVVLGMWGRWSSGGFALLFWENVMPKCCTFIQINTIPHISKRLTTIIVVPAQWAVRNGLKSGSTQV